MTLGNFATKFVLQTETGITRLRGQVHEWHGRTVIPTFHPAAILHGGGEKSRQFQLLLDDFRLVRRTLDARRDRPAASRRRPSPRRPSRSRWPPARRDRGAAGAASPCRMPLPVGAEPDPDQLELF